MCHRQDEFILEYMNTPGTFGFYRPWVHRALVLRIREGRTQFAYCQVDYGVMGLQDL